MPAAADIPDAAWLLPAYDEYTVGYTDRSALLDPPGAAYVAANHSILFPSVVIGGKVVATWRRTIKKRAIEIELNPFAPLSQRALRLIEAAADRYGAFFGLPAEVKL